MELQWVTEFHLEEKMSLPEARFHHFPCQPIVGGDCYQSLAGFCTVHGQPVVSL